MILIMADTKVGRRAKLEQLPTAQLEHMLLLSLEDEVDTETVQCILDILQQRKQPGEIDTQRALEKLEQYYNTPDGMGQELYSSCRAAPAAARQKSRRFRWLTQIAACLAIALLVMVAAQAAGVDVFGTLAHWTDSIFRFSTAGGEDSADLPGATTSAETDEALRQALTQQELPTGFVPTWLPEGYQLVEQKQLDTFATRGLRLTFSGADGRHLQITIEANLYPEAVTASFYEKDAGDAETLISHGREFYLFSNKGLWTGVWSDCGYTVSIVGAESKAVLAEIVAHFGGA